MDRAEWVELDDRVLLWALKARGVRQIPAERLVEQRDGETVAMLIDRAMGRMPHEPAPPDP